MLEIKNLYISVNDRYLIKDLNLTLNKGDKLGVIGEEGNGKSTLLKAILGLCEYAQISGTIDTHNKRVGYLEQSINEKDQEKTVYEYLFISDEDYYNKNSNFYKYLNDLKINEDLLKQKIETLSGGEKIKIGLLKLLLNDYDILFLDEPTNDLDIESLNFLESFIIEVNKPIMFVSHDETLLSKTANMILHLEQIKHKTDCTHTLLKMNYNDYINARLRKINKETQIAKNEKREYTKKEEKLKRIMNKVEHQQNAISRGDPHGAAILKKKMHSLKSQEKKLENTILPPIPDVEENINFTFENTQIPKNKKILDITKRVLKINDKILAENVNLEVVGNEHICIVGKNGVGKSTLIKEIYTILKDRTDISVGYMPQNYEDILNDYEHPIDYISPSKNKDLIMRARMYLGSMKFTRDEMLCKIKDLSNGTKAKLFLIKFVIDGCNCLILDEPTRNVSPLSNPVIRKVLKEFKGTIISVSHDRTFINEVITTTYELTNKGLRKININY